MKSIIFLISFLMTVIANSATIDDIIYLNDTQKEILNNFKNGIISKKEHNIFWKNFKDINNDNVLELNTIHNNLINLYIWQSADDTLKNAKIIYNEDFLKEKKRIYDFYQKYNIDLKSYNQIIKNCENILYSVLYSQPLIIDNFEVIVDEEFINSSIQDNRSIHKRLNILFNQKYQLNQTLYKTDKLSLSSHQFYSNFEDTIFIKNKEYHTQALVSDEVDSIVYSIISFIDKIDDKKLLEDILSQSYESSFGATLNRIEKINFDNLYGYESVGSRDIKGMLFFGSIAVIMTKSQYVHIVSVYTNQASDTKKLLNDFLKTIDLK